MLVFYLIYLFNIYKDIVGFGCIYTEEQMIYNINNYTYEDFERRINQYPSYDYKNDNNVCRVEIFIDYDDSSITISFADSVDGTIELDDGEGRLDFLIVLDETATKPEYYNVLEYACYDDNLCDKTFVLNHIHWLLQVNYSTLETELKHLILKNLTKIEKCFIDKTNSINCSNGFCLGKYSTYYSNYYFECHENSDASAEVHITTTMITDATVDKTQMIRYTCKSNLCNSQALTDSLRNLLQIYYPLKEMEDAFLPTDSYPDSDYVDDTTTQTTTTTRAVNNKALLINTVNKSFIILINLIFLLCLTF